MSESKTPRTDIWQDEDWEACGNNNDYRRMLLAYGHCRQLETELTALREQLRAAEKDAARLKHLHDDPKRAQAYFWNHQGRKQRTEAIDAAIDAALKEPK